MKNVYSTEKVSPVYAYNTAAGCILTALTQQCICNKRTQACPWGSVTNARVGNTLAHENTHTHTHRDLWEAIDRIRFYDGEGGQ